MSIARLMQMAAAGQAGDYQISRSLRFNSADSAYLNRTPASAGNRKTFTWSGWVKRSAVGAGSAVLFSANTASGTTGYTAFFFQSGVDNLYFETIEAGGGKVWETTSLYRDVSAWYHVVLAIDTSQATATNRVKMYVNGTQITAFSTQNTITLDFLTSVNDTVSHDIGAARNVGGTRIGYYNGYMTEINFIDGQALTPSSFGEINADTGVWSPIRYAGTYGTNGFYLNFSDNTSTTTLGDDLSGNGNDWTTNNFSVTAGAGNDSLVDSPTRYGTDTGAGGEVRGNYCTLNPLGSNTTVTLSNGNLQGTTSTALNWWPAVGTFGMSSGKWYWEQTLLSGTSSFVGLSAEGSSIADGFYPGAASNSYGYNTNGSKYNNGSASAYGATFTANDVIGVAFDADAGTLAFYKNGASQGTAFSSIPSGTYFARVGFSGDPIAVNFGQRPFAYTAPSGFKALVTTNLPNPTIVEGDDYFNTVLYTGTGSSQSITGVGFQPDFVWIKERSGAADHGLYDAVRGVQQQLESNTTTDETTESTGLTAFGTDGFTVGSLAQLNTNTDTYVAWNWKESTTSKFDIVTYTGNGTARTISHNLGVVPNMIIVKARTTASTDQGWPVYHSANTAAPATDYLLLNSSAATADLDTVWNDTAPTSSVFSVGTNALVNANNDTYVAYLFANVAGFSAFGSYTGNGSADGPFVYTGFRPAFVMVKRTDLVGNWLIQNNKALGYNPSNSELYANLSNAETTADRADFLSNGFKPRINSGENNASGGTYIYMAFAENPFKNSLAR